MSFYQNRNITFRLQTPSVYGANVLDISVYRSTKFLYINVCWHYSKNRHNKYMQVRNNSQTTFCVLASYLERSEFNVLSVPDLAKCILNVN